jgi:hypothetical protein
MLRLFIAVLYLSASAACIQQKPFFASVLLPQDTTDEVGPYRIQAYVVAPAGVGRLVVRLRDEPYDPPGADRQSFAEKRLEPLDPEDEEGPWVVDIDGRPAGTQLWYHLVLVEETTGSLVRDPIDAPENQHFFQVLPGD